MISTCNAVMHTPYLKMSYIYHCNDYNIYNRVSVTAPAFTPITQSPIHTVCPKPQTAQTTRVWNLDQMINTGWNEATLHPLAGIQVRLSWASPHQIIQIQWAHITNTFHPASWFWFKLHPALTSTVWFLTATGAMGTQVELEKQWFAQWL